MKATINALNHAPKFAISDRKENHFTEQYTAVVFNGNNAYDAVILRLYATEARTYACLWVHGNCSWDGNTGDYWRNGSGRAGGYGYHRASAAAEEAIRNAGIALDINIGGMGNAAIEEAVHAIASAMWDDRHYIHITHSNA